MKNNNTIERGSHEATYHNNLPTCNGRKVIDTHKGAKVTLSSGDFKGTYKVIDWNRSDEYGRTLETVTLKNVLPFSNEVTAYSDDEGATFYFEVYAA